MNKLTISTIAIQFIAIVIISAFMFNQCKSGADKEREISRLEMNNKAANDTIKTYVSKSGKLTTEISAYMLDAKKDKDRIKDLTGENTHLKGLIATGNGTGSVTGGGNVHVTNVQTSDTTGNLILKDSTIYNATNYSKVYSKVPYTLSLIKKKFVTPKDTTWKIKPVISVSEEASYTTKTVMDIYFSFQEEKKGELTVRVSTPHKGVTFNSLQGGVLRGQDLPASMRNDSKKSWGFGYSAGIGLLYDPIAGRMMPGVFVGIGINYTPKKIQF